MFSELLEWSCLLITPLVLKCIVSIEMNFFIWGFEYGKIYIM